MSAASSPDCPLWRKNRELIAQRSLQKSRLVQPVWEPSVGWLTPSERQILEENDRLPDGYLTVDERQRGFRLTHKIFKEICDGSKTFR